MRLSYTSVISFPAAPSVSADLLSEVEARQVRRDSRWRAQAYQRRRSKRHGGRKCGTPLRDLGGPVGITVTHDSTHLSGIFRCSSSWACPTCSPTIARRRAIEVAAVVAAAKAAGHRVYFVTGTLRHHHGDDLAALLDLCGSGFAAVCKNGKRNGIVGWVRTVEITYGWHGWHPHVHAVLIVRADVDGESLMAARGARFREAIAQRGGYSDPVHGWDVREVGDDGRVVSDYLAKIEGADEWTVGDELTRVDLKRRGGAKPFDLLTRAVEGDVLAGDLWAVYESATAGRPRVLASDGLMDAFGVLEVSDEEASAEEVTDEAIATALVDPDDWTAVLDAGRVGPLLSAIENLVRWGEPLPPWVPPSLTIRPGGRGSQPDRAASRPPAAAPAPSLRHRVPKQLPLWDVVR